MAIAYEAQSDFRLNSAALKQWTGGDEVKVRMIYKEPFSYKPEFKVIIVCNPEPNLNAYDNALKRRIKLIPFEYVVAPENKDPKLGEKLKLERAGILNFLIKGAAMYFADQIVEPGKVTNATEKYINRQDTISLFFGEMVVVEKGASVAKTDLYQGYVEFCGDDALDPVSQRDFTKELKRKGIPEARTAIHRGWGGIRLRHPGEKNRVQYPFLKKGGM